MAEFREELLLRKGLEVRRDVLRLISLSQCGGLRESLSLVELFVYLYHVFLRVNPQNPLDPRQDRFLLGCFQASPVHYVMLAHRGFFPREDLWSYGKLGAVLQGTPDIRRTPGIRYPASSQGHVLGIAAGMALELRNRASREEPFRIVVCLDVTELQEGVAWEALRIAREFSLGDILLVVNCPHRPGAVRPSIWLDVERIRSRMDLLGWSTSEKEGHSYGALHQGLSRFSGDSSLPRALFLRTREGKGLPSLEQSNRCPDLSDRSWLAGALRELESPVYPRENVPHD